jgi:hypothetical protein
MANLPSPSQTQGRVRIVAVRADDDMIRMTIEDNGPGMPPEVKEHCLEPFFTTKTRGISTGLGLTLVHGIVQNAKGRLELDSTPGKGTIFHLVLPARRDTDQSGPREKCIAIVQVDDARVRALLEHELQSLDFEYVEQPVSGVARADVLVIEATDDRSIADRFLQENPTATVLLIGSDRTTTASGDNVIEIGPGIQRKSLREALQRVKSRTSSQEQNT